MSSSLLRPMAVAFLVTLALGCGIDFDPASRVMDFRLIAVEADKPYAAPGEDVALAPLYHEPFGRPITWAWAVCLNPADTTVGGCLAELALRARATGALDVKTGVGMDRFTWRVPADAISALPPGGRGGAMAGVVIAACPGALRIDSVGTGGTAAPPSFPFHCTEAGSGVELPYERFVIAVKRIFLRERDKNANPRIGAVMWDGAPWPENEVRETGACTNDTNVYDDCTGGEEHVVAAVPADGATERGTDELGTTFAEQVVVQHYATEGTFEFETKTGESEASGTGWLARRSARGKEVTMWFVIRENRGGVGWTSRRIRVRP